MITPTTTRAAAADLLVTCILAAFLTAGCSAVHFVERDGRAPGYLELKVEPQKTEVYVDERFRGTVAQWSDTVMTLEAGHHGVRLSLEGHYTRRFDVRIRRGAVRRLEVIMTEKVVGVRRRTPPGSTAPEGAVIGRGGLSRDRAPLARRPRVGRT